MKLVRKRMGGNNGFCYENYWCERITTITTKFLTFSEAAATGKVYMKNISMVYLTRQQCFMQYEQSMYTHVNYYCFLDAAGFWSRKESAYQPTVLLLLYCWLPAVRRRLEQPRRPSPYDPTKAIYAEKEWI